MLFIKFCVLIGSVTFASAQNVPLWLQGDFTSLNHGLDFASKLVDYGFSIVINGSEIVSEIGRFSLEKAVNFSSEHFSEGVKLANEGLDLVNKFAGYLPGCAEDYITDATHFITAPLNYFTIDTDLDFMRNMAKNMENFNSQLQSVAKTLRYAAKLYIKIGKSFVAFYLTKANTARLLSQVKKK